MAKTLPKHLSVRLLQQSAYILNYRKQTITRNLIKGLKLSPREAQTLLLPYYKHLAEVIVSQAKQEKPSLQIRGINNINLALKSYNSILLLGSHLGDWEGIGKAISPLLEEARQYGIYKSIHNRYIDRYIFNKRKTDRIVPLSKKDMYKTLLKNERKRTKGVYYLIADQYPSALNNVVETEFLNQKTWFTNGPEKIANKLNIPVFMTVIEGQKLQVIQIYNPTEELYSTSIMQRYAEILEKNILGNPMKWLWSHKRWKNLDRP